MSKSTQFFVVVLLACSLDGWCQAAVPPRSRPRNARVPANLSVGQARIYIAEMFQRTYRGDLVLGAFSAPYQVFPVTNVQVRADGVRYTTTLQRQGKKTDERGSGEQFLPFASMGEVTIMSRQVREPGELFTLQSRSVGDAFKWVWWTSEDDAQHCADALNRLSAGVQRGETVAFDPFDKFQQQAAAWRAASSKPAVPEEIDRHRVLAESGVREKEFESAAAHYEDGLLRFDTWPQGWFNLALIEAELTLYADASDSMRHYLELAPDASDAHSAREQRYVWDEKAKQQATDLGSTVATPKPLK